MPKNTPRTAAKNVRKAFKALNDAVEAARDVAPSGGCATCGGSGEMDMPECKALAKSTCPVCNGMGVLDAGEAAA